jgi:hypothetical protein
MIRDSIDQVWRGVHGATPSKLNASRAPPATGGQTVRLRRNAGGREDVDVDSGAGRRASGVRVLPPIRPRKLAKVPFVELADGRLQGVVSSGSDIERVYVSSITAGDHAFTCSTNNNRPCGGLGGSLCNHLRALVDEAVGQYGVDRVARYLRVTVDDDASSGADVVRALHGHHQPAPSATVFSRFLHHLSYLELPDSTQPVPELHWFPSTRTVD